MRYGKVDSKTSQLTLNYTFGQRRNVLNLGIDGEINNISMPAEPTQEIVALLAAAGILPIVDTVFDPATHKLVDPPRWSDDGLEITQNTIALTADEISAAAADRVANLLIFVAGETSGRIKAIISQDNQLRLLAKGLLITNRMAAGVATEAEIAAAAEIEAFDVDILQPIRDAGTAIEAEVRAGDITTELEISTHIRYP